MNKNKVIYHSIYFDSDSTLVDIEGIDELAGFYNKKLEVARFTEKAMSGQVRLEDVFSLKLAMIRPHKNDFDKLGKLFVKRVVEDAKDVIDALHYLKKRVVLMTGNFYPAVNILAKYLKIPDENVYANNIIFDENGNYLTFDNKGPLSVAGGKRSLIMILKREGQKNVFVGDSFIDAETKPPVDLFVGYGGVVTREKVKHISDIFITCKSMAAILPFILTSKEENYLNKSQYRSVLTKAYKLVEAGFAIRNQASVLKTRF